MNFVKRLAVNQFVTSVQELVILQKNVPVADVSREEVGDVVEVGEVTDVVEVLKTTA